MITLPPSLPGATNVAVITNGDGSGLLIASVSDGIPGTDGVVIPNESPLIAPVPSMLIAPILYLYSVSSNTAVLSS